MKNPARELRVVAAALCLLAKEETGRPRKRFLLAARVLRREADTIAAAARARANPSQEGTPSP
ncbi:hypothetical protein ACFPOB_20685 [Bosea eneae]|uniref:Transposase n=1 Tax=Bosea eneae TaxID=151454 RepID=A0ABW0IYN4_9HYPH